MSGFLGKTVKCPHCGKIIEVPKHVSHYDWNTRYSDFGLAEIACHQCKHCIKVSARADIYNVEVVDGD